MAAGDEALRGSARTLVGFLRWLVDAVIFTVIVLLPIGLVIAAVVLALRWLWKRVTGGLPQAPPPGDGPPSSDLGDLLAATEAVREDQVSGPASRTAGSRTRLPAGDRYS